MGPFNASLVVLNYNGEEFLLPCIASLVEALRHSRYQHEIILVDNASTDRSVEWVRRDFPQVRIVQNPTNRCYLGIKDGIAAAKHDYVLLLNNDIVVEPDFLDPLLEHFVQPDVFAVTSRVIEARTGKEGDSATRAIYTRGYLYVEGVPGVTTTHTTFVTHGGQSAIDKTKLLRIGNLDDLLRPIYNEDVELSYRAWKCGYRILYEPRSTVTHYGGRTTTQLWTRAYIKRLHVQNMVLLTWKCFTDPAKVRDLWLYHPFRIVKALLTGDIATFRGYLGALLRFGEMLRARAAIRPLFIKSDAEVLDLLSGPRSCP